MIGLDAHIFFTRFAIIYSFSFFVLASRIFLVGCLLIAKCLPFSLLSEVTGILPDDRPPAGSA